MARHKEQMQEAADMPEILPEWALAIVQAQDAGAVLDVQVTALAEKLGYHGPLTKQCLKDGVRTFQRQTVDALLQSGIRLVLLKEITAHGEFMDDLAELGFADRSARRLMNAARKVGQNGQLAVLGRTVKNASAFLELITHDDDVIENLAAMDKFELMSASQVRAAARELQEEADASAKLVAKLHQKNDKLSRHIEKLTPDDKLAELEKECTQIMTDAVNCLRGQLYHGLMALKEHDAGDRTLFMAGLVGQVQFELAALREEFNLPDVGKAADLEMAAEVAQWMPKKAKA